jgi:3' terminal RNA ribose 2'-O-methyltransferase Hen1
MTTWLHDQRIEAVLAVLRARGATTVLDLGCGAGALALRLIHERRIGRVVGVDLSADALHDLRAGLRDEPSEIRRKLDLVHGSMTELDGAFGSFDAAVSVESIEHVAPDRLSRFERSVFANLSPATVIVTTPNRDFNGLLGVPPHRFRHPDHRFEWGRAKFRSWAAGTAGRSGYDVAFHDVAGAHPVFGGATQMAVFRRRVGTSDRQAARPGRPARANGCRVRLAVGSRACRRTTVAGRVIPDRRWSQSALGFFGALLTAGSDLR